MKDRIIFFILGALLATFAYLAGDLKMLTAQDKLLELERLKVGILEVDSLNVADIVHVGGNGKPFVTIAALNKNARISLAGKGEDAPSALLSVTEKSASIGLTQGGEDAPSAELGVMERYADIKLTQGGEDAPSLRLRVQKDVGAGIDGMSHAKRPEAHFEIFTVKRDGAFRSGMLIKDSRGTDGVDTGW